MEPDIAFHTGYLWGYLNKMGISALPVIDLDGNYLPDVDIRVPKDTSDLEGDSVVIRVRVREVVR